MPSNVFSNTYKRTNLDQGMIFPDNIPHIPLPLVDQG